MSRFLLFFAFFVWAGQESTAQTIAWSGAGLPNFTHAGTSQLDVQRLATVNISGRPLGSIIRREDGTVRWWKGDITNPGPKLGKSNEAYSSSVAASLDSIEPFLLISRPSENLDAVKVNIDERGNHHFRFQQYHLGLPVWKSFAIAHVSEEGALYALNGDYVSSSRLPREYQQPIRPDEAIQSLPPAFELLIVQGADPAPILSFVPLKSGEVILAYVIRRSTSLRETWDFVVDAYTGEVAEKHPLHAAHTHSRGSFQSSASPDLTGQVKGFRSYIESDGRQALIWDTPNIDPVFSLDDGPSVGGILTIETDGQNFTHVAPSSGVWNPSAVSAHINAKIAYDYFSSQFGRKAIDDLDGTIYSIVGIQEDGAFWNNGVMLYGVGGQIFEPLAEALDVAAHEMTHGVIEHSAGLEYRGQSGALSESFADIFGVLVENEDYLIGEDVIRNGVALRDLSNPSNANLLSPQPWHMSNFEVLPETKEGDYGGVHKNSGIPNYAAFLVINALGTADAASIYYRALTNYLTPRSQFFDARMALEAAAIDLFGDESGQLQVVRSAFDVVGITTDGLPSDSGDNDVPAVLGISSIAMVADNGSVMILNTLLNEVVTYLSAPLVNDGSQLSIPRNGHHLYYADTRGKVIRLDMRSGEYAVSEAVYATTPGDVRNAVVSPDGSLLAYSSSELTDSALYFADSEISGVRLPLTAQTTQPGILDRSIVYPDVISWSPNMDDPRIAFDALRSVHTGPNPVAFWSTYVIDFLSGRISNLVPTQLQSTDLGNFTFSATDPDLVAFNEIDRTSDTTYLHVCDLNAAFTCLELGVSLGLPDAERPTFSPRSDSVAFTSAENNQLILSPFDATTAIAYTFAQPVRNPLWFAWDAESSVDSERPWSNLHGDLVVDLYPNPSSTKVTIDLNDARRIQSSFRVFDLLGREVSSSGEHVFATGSASYELDVSSWRPGAYLLRISSGTLESTSILVVAR